MKITVLGCGASMGTPTAGNFWGVCDPGEPRNERTRASILVQSDKTNILVDATYDLRTQVNRAGVSDLTGVILTHEHSDHINGLDDLRPIAFNHHKLMDVYADAETFAEVEKRWSYMFTPTSDAYTAFLRKNLIERYGHYAIGDISFTTFEQDHYSCKSLGLRFGDFAYSVDVADLDQKSLDRLKGLDTWIVGAGAYHKETVKTHANLKRVLGWVELLKPKMTYLSVLTTHMDYKTLCDELPPHVRPAYDGLEIIAGSNQR